MKLLRRKRKAGTARNISSSSRLGIPQPSDVLLCQHHRRIKSNNREIPSNVQNFPNNLLAGFRIEKVNLSGVVPRQPRTIVPVINVSGIAGMVINPFKHHCAIRFGIVMIFQVNPDTGITGKVFPVKIIARKRTFASLHKKIRPLHHPL